MSTTSTTTNKRIFYTLDRPCKRKKVKDPASCTSTQLQVTEFFPQKDKGWHKTFNWYAFWQCMGMYLRKRIIGLCVEYVERPFGYPAWHEECVKWSMFFDTMKGRKKYVQDFLDCFPKPPQMLRVPWTEMGYVIKNGYYTGQHGYHEPGSRQNYFSRFEDEARESESINTILTPTTRKVREKLISVMGRDPDLPAPDICAVQ